MKTLIALTATVLLATAVSGTDARADELSVQLQAITVAQLHELKPATIQQARQAMQQTIIDVVAHLQAEQDVAQLLALQLAGPQTRDAE